MEILQNLKERRLNKGWTQMDMCFKVGVSLLTYRMWENGVSTPNPENMEKLVQAFKEE